MSAIEKRQWTPEEYLAFERAADQKHELIDGDIFLMSGASRRHNLLVFNLAVTIGNQLRDRPCEAYTSDLRVRLQGTQYVYPDLTVVCGEPAFEDAEVDTLTNPTVLVEVLSPSTETYDRGKKFQYYRELASLQEYVLVSQERYWVEKYSRQENGQWLLTDATGVHAVVNLPSIECNIPLAELYAKVVFESE